MTFKVLIVDDMPDAVMMLTDVMQNAGYDTVSASRGQQALALAEEVRPDIILLDVMMPDMDGIETCRRLHLNPTTKNIPVILVSARSPSEARGEGLIAGAADYVTKPIHFADLLQRMERLINTPAEPVPDHLRLAEEMVYTTLAVVPCDLAWLLAIDKDNRYLVHQAIGIIAGVADAGDFLQRVGVKPPERQLPILSAQNPLVDAALTRRAMLDMPVANWHDLAGGSMFAQAFERFGLAYITLLPLIATNDIVGVLALATSDHTIADSERSQQILNSLSSQAAMVVKNARLLVDLAASEAQTKAEQSFRQLVLDTMGEGLVVVDEEAKIIYANNRLLLLTGYTREDLYGQSVGKIFHPDQSARLIESLTQKRRGTQPFDQSLYSQSGRIIPVLLSRAVTSDPSDQRQITVMVVSDLSELHSNRDALELHRLRLQALNRASTLISAANTYQDVVNVSLEASREVVHGQAGSLFLVDKDTRELYETVTVGPRFDTPLYASPNKRRRMRLGEGLIGWVAQNSQSHLILDITQPGEIKATYTAIYGDKVRSLLLVPVITLDNLLGVLEIVTLGDKIFSTQDLAVLETLAGSAAIALENTRLLDETRRRVAELSTLLEASAAVTTTLDFGSILAQIGERLRDAIKVERVLILDWYPGANRLEPLAEAVKSYWPPDNGPLITLEDHPLTHAAFAHKNALSANGNALVFEEINASGLYAYAAFPINLPDAPDTILGVLTLYNKTAGDSMPAQLVETVAQGMADMIAGWKAKRIYAKNWHNQAPLAALCAHVLQLSGSHWCSVAYWDEAQDNFRLLYESGQVLWVNQASQLWDTRLYPSLAYALEQGETTTIVRNTALATPEQAFLQRVGGHTCLIAPLHVRGESRGLVTLIDSKPEPRVFDQNEMSLCQGIANILGNAMENSTLYTEQEQRATALEAAYEQLRQADQIKNNLLQNLSHELRTPLTHIIGYVRLLQDGAFGEFDAEQRDVIDLVTTKSQQLADIVEDIVMVQEPDAYDLTLESIHLERVVAIAVRKMTAQAAAQGIRIMPDIADNLPEVYADPERIEDVLKELIDNAIKFSPRGSEIDVVVEDPGGASVRVCVRDKGIGIPVDEQDKIFYRFYQVDSGTTRRFGGTGLGLAVVRQIIVGHNGRVWVESDPGEGSRFYMTLPKTSALAIDD
ncbi:MAG: GAF domain-containing protein [Anaerolineae bacterium]|nr:GAF domain-containing protein [Anaerolineae bacterium]